MPDKLEKKVVAEKKKLAREKQVLLDDMFNDLYSKRTRIYKLNFFRGVFFGLGTFLGGTVVIAIIVWVLSNFVDWPLINKLVEALQR